MSLPQIHHCPGTLAPGHDTYSKGARARLFGNHSVHHVLPYGPPYSDGGSDALFEENQRRISISGVQEKFSVLQAKNRLRLIREGERGTHILKPMPRYGKHRDQMPANEHLTMQIARQLFGIETAENALIFFRDGQPAYITKRFDVRGEGDKWAKEDFASLAGRTPQTHGEHYKYLGSYEELFHIMQRYLPAHRLEAPKLFKRLVFNYLFSNGDAHFKNFSILETPQGDFRLSPAYDLLNTRIHVDDADFALEDGLLPRKYHKDGVPGHFRTLAERVGLGPKQVDRIFGDCLSHTQDVENLIAASYLDPRIQRSYLQGYQTRLKKLERG